MDQMQADPRGRPAKFSRSAALSALGALGIVYGDIGTSPLYALKVAVQAAGEAPGVAVVGIASLIIWSLVVVVSLKYAILILRADNHGEGGVVAMLALLNAREAAPKSWRHGLLILGLIGAALLYGDGAITPAISVLSAVEGLKADAPALTPAVLPITIAILVALFLAQSKGTGFIGKLFGPIMLIWFAALALLGTVQIVHTPQVLEALTPWPAINFVAHASLGVSFAVLGAVFLAVTGGEAMYADMGHFGRFPIRAAWFVIALPALVLNYLGQAALIVRDPSALANPFFGLAPAWAHFPLIAFATAATVIASQAIISGVFSLTQQSVQLGFLPRLSILHTSAAQEGQVYLPLANWLLMVATLTAVLLFRSSDALAGAYGIAVSGLMAISTFLAGLIALRWGYPPALILLVNGSFLIVDLIFFAANATKLFEGGWFPLALAGLLAFLMLTWRSGVALVEAARADQRENEVDFIKQLTADSFARTPGIAAFLSTARSGIPLALSHHLRHNRALQERVLLVSVETTETPFVADDERVKVTKLSDGMERVILRYGFMEDLDVPHGLRCADLKMSQAQLDELSYYIGHETVIADPHIPGMAPWREAFFVSMQRNTAPTGASFCIPSKQVVEVGTEIRI